MKEEIHTNNLFYMGSEEVISPHEGVIRGVFLQPITWQVLTMITYLKYYKKTYLGKVLNTLLSVTKLRSNLFSILLSPSN